VTTWEITSGSSEPLARWTSACSVIAPERLRAVGCSHLFVGHEASAEQGPIDGLALTNMVIRRDELDLTGSAFSDDAEYSQDEYRPRKGGPPAAAQIGRNWLPPSRKGSARTSGHRFSSAAAGDFRSRVFLASA